MAVTLWRLVGLVHTGDRDQSAWQFYHPPGVYIKVLPPRIEFLLGKPESTTTNVLIVL